MKLVKTLLFVLLANGISLKAQYFNGTCVPKPILDFLFIDKTPINIASKSGKDSVYPVLNSLVIKSFKTGSQARAFYGYSTYLYIKAGNEIYHKNTLHKYPKDTFLELDNFYYTVFFVPKDPVVYITTYSKYNSFYETQDHYFVAWGKKIRADKIRDSLAMINKPPLPPSYLKGGYLKARLNKAKGDSKGSSSWVGKGTGGGEGGNSSGWGARDSSYRKAKKAAAAGYSVKAIDSCALKMAPRGTYHFEIEIDCEMKATYIGDRGGTAKDDPATGKSRAKAIQAFLNCATITKTSAALCPARVIVTFSIDY